MLCIADSEYVGLVLAEAQLFHLCYTKDLLRLVSQLQGMINAFEYGNSIYYLLWSLYHKTPLLNAQEYSLPDYLTAGFDEELYAAMDRHVQQLYNN